MCRVDIFEEKAEYPETCSSKETFPMFCGKSREELLLPYLRLVEHSSSKTSILQCRKTTVISECLYKEEEGKY